VMEVSGHDLLVLDQKREEGGRNRIVR
jgi:hypothetical protein